MLILQISRTQCFYIISSAGRIKNVVLHHNIFSSFGNMTAKPYIFESVWPKIYTGQGQEENYNCLVMS